MAAVVPSAPCWPSREQLCEFILSHAAVPRPTTPAPLAWAYWSTESLRVSGYYWALLSLALVGEEARLRPAVAVPMVWAAYDPETGGFGGHTGYSGHLLYTLSALQVLWLCGALAPAAADTDARLARTASWIASLQRGDGGFSGDRWGELDTRFSYCALASLGLLGALDRVDLRAAAEFILSCRNPDGGFGAAPGAESHAGSVFTALGALAIAGGAVSPSTDGGVTNGRWSLPALSAPERTVRWLRARQMREGGLNGRPAKAPDACYAWWVTSSLSMLGHGRDLDSPAVCRWLQGHISVDSRGPGFAGHVGRPADIYHTCFALAGLSLLTADDPHCGNGGSACRPPWRLAPIEPAWCLPRDDHFGDCGRDGVEGRHRPVLPQTRVITAIES